MSPGSPDIARGSITLLLHRVWMHMSIPTRALDLARYGSGREALLDRWPGPSGLSMGNIQEQSAHTQPLAKWSFSRRRW
jgi:hypothetical protein